MRQRLCALGVVVCLVVAEPGWAGLRKQCARYCELAAGQCAATEGFRMKKCRRLVRKRCRREGLSICVPTTTTVTTTTGTTLAVEVTTTLVVSTTTDRGTTVTTSTSTSTETVTTTTAEVTTTTLADLVGDWNFTGTRGGIACPPGITFPVTLTQNFRIDAVGADFRATIYAAPFDLYATLDPAATEVFGFAYDADGPSGCYVAVRLYASLENVEYRAGVTADVVCNGITACRVIWGGMAARQ